MTDANRDSVPPVETTEWAVMCAGGYVNLNLHKRADCIHAAEKFNSGEWLCHGWNPNCGPHRVVSRTVSAWTEVSDG